MKNLNLLQKAVCQTANGKYNHGDTTKFETENIKSKFVITLMHLF